MNEWLQLHLYVKQPKTITKEDLFSERKKEDLLQNFHISEIDYEHIKETTNFITYNEFLNQLCNIKNRLNSQYFWDNTVYFTLWWKQKSNHWIMEHLKWNLKQEFEVIKNFKDIKRIIPDTIIIPDDCAYSWIQLTDTICTILDQYTKYYKWDEYWKIINFVIAMPYLSSEAKKWLKFIENEAFNNKIKIILPDNHIEIETYYSDKNKGFAEDSPFQYKSYTPTIFEHKKWHPVSIWKFTYHWTEDINPIYKKK